MFLYFIQEYSDTKVIVKQIQKNTFIHNHLFFYHNEAQEIFIFFKVLQRLFTLQLNSNLLIKSCKKTDQTQWIN